jgi:hypothetical protein
MWMKEEFKFDSVYSELFVNSSVLQISHFISQ